MNYPGYRWKLVQDGAGWRWSVVGRDDCVTVFEGVAGSRAEAAACLVRAMSIGVLNTPGAIAA